MAVASVGRSMLGPLRGVEQFIEVRAARQLNLCLDFVATLPGCYRATVNEGQRSRERQLLLYREYLAGRGNLAAVPFTSTHDEVTANTAADIGGPNGEALAGPTLTALRRYGPAYGVFPTGMDFSRPESWHFNVYANRAIITTAAVALTPIDSPRPEEDDMKPLFIIGTQKSDQREVVDFFLVNPQDFTYIHVESETQKDFWKGLGAVEVQGAQPPGVLANFQPVRTTGPR